jgi:proteasome lid subunit RPN8/RPN11
VSDELDDVDVQLPAEPAPPDSDAIPLVFVSRQAFDVMSVHAASDLDHEVGGILIGTLAGTDERPVVLVEVALVALHTDQSRASVTFTHDTWNHITEVMDRDYPDKRIVGWYHTHPGFGLFLSEYDLFIHRNFFNLPWQLALVVDPRAQRSGLFVWEHGDISGPLRVDVATPAETLGPSAPGHARPAGLGLWRWMVGAGVALVLLIQVGLWLRTKPHPPAKSPPPAKAAPATPAKQPPAAKSKGH